MNHTLENNPSTGKWVVYMLRLKDDSYYTGCTKNLLKRLHDHRNTKRGSKYVRGRLPIQVVLVTECQTRSRAQQLECLLKKQPRAIKEFLEQFFLKRLEESGKLELLECMRAL